MYITCNAAALVSFNIGASELLNQKDMMHVHARDSITYNYLRIGRNTGGIHYNTFPDLNAHDFEGILLDYITRR